MAAVIFLAASIAGAAEAYAMSGEGTSESPYKIRVKVKAVGNKYYKAGTKTVTVKIVVK